MDTNTETPMDPSRFDALARSLATRRTLSAALAAAGIGALVRGAEGKKKKKGCGKAKTRCGGACADLGSDQANCGACGNACGGGTLCCGGACVSVLTDPANCGACGARCDLDQRCVNGTCQNCDAPHSICGSRCVNLQTDREHCGACDNACPRDSGGQASRDLQCVNGNCICTGTTCPNGRCCPAGYSICKLDGAACCPDGFPVGCPDNDRCCPPGYTCGGSCGQSCCRA